MIDLLVGDIIELKKISSFYPKWPIRWSNWLDITESPRNHTSMEEINLFQNGTYAQCEPPPKLII